MTGRGAGILQENGLDDKRSARSDSGSPTEGSPSGQKEDGEKLILST